jgi:hypothetical protein
MYKQHVTQDRTQNEEAFYHKFKNMTFKMYIDGQGDEDRMYDQLYFWKDNNVIKVGPYKNITLAEFMKNMANIASEMSKFGNNARNLTKHKSKYLSE